MLHDESRILSNCFSSLEQTEIICLFEYLSAGLCIFASRLLGKQFIAAALSLPYLH